MSARARRFFGCVLPLVIAIAGCGGVLMAGYAGQVFVQALPIEDEAMSPIVEIDQTVIVDNTVYWSGSPDRGTIVSVDSPDGLVIRHVVGLPGERVRIDAGKVFIDDLPCDGSRVIDEETGLTCWFAGQVSAGARPPDHGPVTLEDDQYFVLAERWAARDSRIWGPVSRAAIFGIARFKTDDMRDLAPVRTPTPSGMDADS